MQRQGERKEQTKKKDRGERQNNVRIKREDAENSRQSTVKNVLRGKSFTKMKAFGTINKIY